MTCDEKQNYAGLHEHDFTPAQWDEWAEAYEQKCLGGPIVVTPSKPDPTPND